MTFLRVPPWFSKQFVSISYVPIRSVQTLRILIKICVRILRSYTFRVNTPAEIRNSLSEWYVPIRSVSTVPQKSKKLDLKLTFLHVLDNPYRRIYLLPGPSGQPPATQDMSPGAHKSKTITFHYVLHTFLYVPRQPSFLEGDSWERSERDVSYYAQGHYHARVPVALSGS